MKAKTKIISRLLIVPFLFLLIAGAIIALPGVALADPGAVLQITINNPTGAETYSTCQNFTLTLDLANTGDAMAYGVTVTIDPGLHAEVVVGGVGQGENTSWTSNILGNISAGATWTGLSYGLHCTSPGSTTITATPYGEDPAGTPMTSGNLIADTVTVDQEAKAHLTVTNVTTDAPNVTTVSTQQTFNITATVKNNNGVGGAVAENVSATLSITGGAGTATIDSGPSPVSVATLAGDATQDFSWQVTCTGAGVVNFMVTPTGDDENTGEAVIYPDNIDEGYIDITQEAKAHLSVTAVTTDAPNVTTVSTQQTFNITATVKNNNGVGGAVAENVSATLSITGGTGTATIDSGPTPSPVTLAGDATQDFTWQVTCTGAGVVNFMVTPTGDDENTDAAVIYPANIDEGYIDITQELKAHLEASEFGSYRSSDGNPQDTFSTEQNFYILAVVMNTGEAHALNVTASMAKTAGTGSSSCDLGVSGSVVGGTGNPADLAQGMTVWFRWDCQCTGSGDITFTITPDGTDENTLAAVIYPANIVTDTITIYQENKIHLEVAVVGSYRSSDDNSQTVFSTEQNFYILATVTNTGEAHALNVTASMAKTGGDPDSTSTCDSGVSGSYDSGDDPADLAQGETAVFRWDCQCTGAPAIPPGYGDITFTITPDGTDENTNEPVLPQNIVPDTITITQELKTHLEVTSVVTDTPNDSIISVCQIFHIIATVHNKGFAVAEGVSADLTITGGIGSATINSGPSWIGGTDPAALAYCDSTIFEWEVTCTGSGTVDFMVTPTGNDENTDLPVLDVDPDNVDEGYITITQQTPPELWVEILSPLPWTHVGFSQEFAVTAEVYNSGEATATDVMLTLTIDDYASLVDGEIDQKQATEPGQNPGVITGGGTSDPLTWTLHCDAPGTSTITVTPSGNDLNTGESIAAGCGGLHAAWIDVYQYEKAHLVVEITDFPDVAVSTGQDFTVTATVQNTGEPDAWDVEATISWSPADSVYLNGGTLTQYIGTLQGHGMYETSEPITWNLCCKQACYTTITVTASGYDEYGLAFSKETKYYEGMVETTGGFIDAEYIYLYGAMVYADGFFDGWLDGHFKGNITGDFDGYLEGYFDGRIDGTSYSGPVSGEYYALVDGYFDGYLYGYYAWFEGDVDGYFEGEAEGEFTGNLMGAVYTDGFMYGSADLCFYGYAYGYVDGHYEGDVDGYADAWVEGFLDSTYYESWYTGDFAGYYDGNIEGFYAGDVDGCFTGAFDAFGEEGMYFYGYIYGGSVYVEGEVTEMVMTENPGAPIPENDIESATVTVEQMEKAHLVAEILAPVNGATFSVCQNFDVVAKVYNTGGADAYNVEATIDAGIGASVVPPPDPRQFVTEDGEAEGVITGNGYGEVAWIVHCTEPVQSTISVTPSGYDANTQMPIPEGNIEHDQIIVHQETAAVLEVIDVTASQDTVSVCQNFSVTATITNSGGADAIGVTATIDITGNASVVAPPPETQSIGTIPGGRSTMVGWTLHCDGEGDVNIGVTAEGTDENSGALVITTTPGTTSVTQMEGAGLLANVSAFPSTVSTRQNFIVTATITNNGDATAEDVTATIFIGANASLVSGETPTKIATESGQAPGVITGGGGTSDPVTWTAQCTLPGPSNITVTPAGFDTNTGEPIPKADIAAGSFTVIQQEKAHLVVEILKPVNGDTFSVCQNFDVVAKVYNTGEATAEYVDATIYPGDQVNVLGLDPGWPDTISLPYIYGGTYEEVSWDVHCAGAGQSTISVFASGLDANTGGAIPAENIEHDQIIIHQEEATALDVISIEPSQDTVSVCQNFSVTATVINNGEADAIGVTATIDITAGSAHVVSPPPQMQTIGTIPGGDRTAMVSWTLHCDGEGTVDIMVTATGTDENSGLLDSASLTVSDIVTQEAKAHLAVTSVTPSLTTVSTGQEFDVTATITNSGVATAEDVTGTISIDANASLAGGTPTQAVSPATLAGGGGTGTVTWTLHCNLAGPSTITVTPAGTDANTGEAIPSANTAPGSVTVIQEESAKLEVEILYPSNGDMFYKDDTFIAAAVASNSGQATAGNVELTLDPDIENDPKLVELAGGETDKKTATESGQPLGDITGGKTADPITWDVVAGDTEGYAIIQVVATGDGLGSATDYVIVEIDPPPTMLLYEEANPIAYVDGATTILPIALTNIMDEVVIIWQRDESTGGEWYRYYYYEGMWLGEITHLVSGHGYVIVVTEDCTWELPH